MKCHHDSNLTVNDSHLTPSECLFLKAGSVIALQDKRRQDHTEKNTFSVRHTSGGQDLRQAGSAEKWGLQ